MRMTLRILEEALTSGRKPKASSFHREFLHLSFAGLDFSDAGKHFIACNELLAMARNHMTMNEFQAGKNLLSAQRHGLKLSTCPGQSEKSTLIIC